MMPMWMRQVVNTAQHQGLLYTNISQREGWQFFDAANQPSSVQLRGKLFANNGEVLKAAAISGLDIAYLPDFEISEALASGQLVTLLPAYTAPALTVYALYPSRQFLPEKTRALVEFLIHELQVS